MNAKPLISTGTTLYLELTPTVTELGLCLSVNSKVAEYNSYHYWNNHRWDLIPSKPTVVVHPLDGEVYGQLIKLENSYEVYFHGYMEVPEISKRRYSFLEAFYTTVELHALEIKTSPKAVDLSVSQRKCRFTHEADVLHFSPVYSYNLCRIECRMRLAMKICGCVPHFYRHVAIKTRTQRANSMRISSPPRTPFQQPSTRWKPDDPPTYRPGEAQGTSTWTGSVIRSVYSTTNRHHKLPPRVAIAASSLLEQRSQPSSTKQALGVIVATH
ncbi:uncharacterized protein LOC134221994 [Armigeres subalbatus]|uniref:uncharacterized protein LOC134221994 n=1 Tax=Armigeres subalbatus TaxID=124917 RepID=UPI002ED47096